MGSQVRKWHELFRIETVLRRVRDLSPDLISGQHPEAFARELVTRWGYGEVVSLGSLGYVAKVSRVDTPEELAPGFAQYYGVGFTPYSAALFHTQDQLQEYFENRLLDAQDRKGDFAGGLAS